MKRLARFPYGARLALAALIAVAGFTLNLLVVQVTEGETGTSSDRPNPRR